jgi:hypothetical protein
MHYTFFEKNISNLSKTYGDRYYPAPRIKLLWDSFMGMDGMTFKKAIDRLIETERQAPLKKEILKSITKIMEEQRALQKKQESKDALKSHKSIYDIDKNDNSKQSIYLREIIKMAESKDFSGMEELNYRVLNLEPDWS